jgi:hypothetical protein
MRFDTAGQIFVGFLAALRFNLSAELPRLAVGKLVSNTGLNSSPLPKVESTIYSASFAIHVRGLVGEFSPANYQQLRISQARL